jgi:hypothetical protein
MRHYRRVVTLAALLMAAVFLVAQGDQAVGAHPCPTHGEHHAPATGESNAHLAHHPQRDLYLSRGVPVRRFDCIGRAVSRAAYRTEGFAPRICHTAGFGAETALRSHPALRHGPSRPQLIR